MKKAVLFVLLAAVSGLVSAVGELKMKEISKTKVAWSELAYLDNTYKSDQCLFQMFYFAKANRAQNNGFLYVTHFNEIEEGALPDPRTWQLKVDFAFVEKVAWSKDDAKVAYVQLVQMHNLCGMLSPYFNNVKIYCDGKKAYARVMTNQEAVAILGPTAIQDPEPNP